VTAAPAWSMRPREEANLFNPVFLSQLVDRVAVGHTGTVGSGIPWPLVYLTLPIVLHKPTRDALPHSISTSMASWTRDHPLLVSALPSRARSLRAHVTECLLFGLSHAVINHDDARILPGQRARRSPTLPWRDPTDDYRECANRATFVGRWCGTAGLPATIFALWGVRP
jgi:hypothetical protein